MTEISESIWEQAVEAVAEGADVSDLVNRMADSAVSLALYKAREGIPLYPTDRAMIGQLFDACHVMHEAVIKKAKSISDAWGDP